MSVKKSVYSTGAVLTPKIIDEAVQKMIEESGKPDTFQWTTGNWNFDAYDKEHKVKCQKFEQYFHRGVSFQHIRSEVIWTVDKVQKVPSTGETVAVVISEGGYKKFISSGQYNDFKVIKMPKAVKVLFGE